jgi:hypothetical protein
VLLATLPEARARVVITAVCAAFGPADGGPVPREAAVLASELWGTMPGRTQGAVREHLLEASGFEDYVAARKSVEAAGARAGVLAARDLGAALVVLAGSGPLESDEALAAALRSEPAAGLVRYALSAL